MNRQKKIEIQSNKAQDELERDAKLFIQEEDDCNTRFNKEHKPSNHIRARIKSHVYTTE